MKINVSRGQGGERTARPASKIRRLGLATVLGIVAVLAFATAVGVEVSHALSAPTSGNSTAGVDLSGGDPSGQGGDSSATSTIVPPANTDQTHSPAIPIPGGALPGQGNFNAIACTSSTACLAVGGTDAGNAVAASTGDAGSTWSGQTLPKGASTLDAVACGDSSHCVAVGQGVVVSTSDGGHGWSEHTPPTSDATLLGVSCPSVSSCVAAGVTSTPNAPLGGAVDISSDGGTTWTAAQMPGGTLALGGVACPSVSFCVAVGSSIMVSTDGGSSWSPRYIPGGMNSPLRSVACTSATSCLAVGANVVGEINSSAPAFAVATTDGGASWNTTTMPSATAFIDQIVCAGTSQCFASGSDDQKSGPAAFATSADGGATWQASSPPGGITQVADIACPAPNDCVAVGRDGNRPVTSHTANGSDWRESPVSQAS